jgi:hypothetical protein
MALIKDSRKEGVSEYLKNLNLRTFSTLTKPLTVANIYFVTNESKLCENDRTELNKLADDVSYLLEHKFRLVIFCIGGADHRGRKEFNRLLGEARARSVNNYVINRIKYKLEHGKKLHLLKNYDIKYTSVGEGKAAQPEMGSVPSPSRLCIDRKVEIRVCNRGSIPPVAIAVIGKRSLAEMLVKSIERMEVNNGGRILAANDEADAVIREQKYQISKGIRKRPVDYMNPFVFIEITTSQITGQGKKMIGHTRCYAYYKKSQNAQKQQLFTVHVSTEVLSKEDLKQYVYCPVQKLSIFDRFFGSDKTIVCRVYDEEQEQYNNDRYEMRIRYEKSVKLKILKLEKIIYNKLRANFPNINKRVEKILNDTIQHSN